MWKLHRYYLKEIAFGTLMTFTVLFGIVLISTVPRGLKMAVGVGLFDAVKLTVLWTMGTIPHLLPISPLFGTVLAYARAGQDREITAIRAAGISPRAVMTPAILVGITFSLIAAITLHYLVPWATYEKRRVVPKTIRTALLAHGMVGDKLEFSGVIMTWEGRTTDGGLEDVEIVFEDPKDSVGFGMGAIITAEAAHIEASRDGAELSLVLDGARTWGEHQGYLGQPRIAVDVESISASFQLDENDKDLWTDQILAEVYRGVHPDPPRGYYVAYRRSCLALLPLLLAPIGFALGILARDRGRMTALTFALVPVMVAYGTDVIASNLFNDTGVASLAWLPAVILFVIGLPFTWRLVRY